MAGEYKVTQAEFSGITASQLIDSEFLGLLRKEFPNVSVISIGIATANENGKVIQVFHSNPKAQEEGVLTVDSNDPDTFSSMANVIAKFKKD
jgi:uracil phosphoribosyltransferase